MQIAIFLVTEMLPIYLSMRTSNLDALVENTSAHAFYGQQVVRGYYFYPRSFAMKCLQFQLCDFVKTLAHCIFLDRPSIAWRPDQIAAAPMLLTAARGGTPTIATLLVEPRVP
jgi:hypothetical protein